MQTRPAGLDEQIVHRALARGWGARDARLRYLPAGFGSYHWIAEAAGARYFLTVDDLSRKPWLGSAPDAAFAGLRAAFDTALALHDGAGLECVIAPVPALDGTTLHRLTGGYSLAVFPFAEGACGLWGEQISRQDRGRLIRLLADLHLRTPTVAALARRHEPGLAERAVLEAALAELDLPWSGGPFSEPARRELTAGADIVAAWLASFDRLAALVTERNAGLVVTHGEPHPGNVVRAGARFRLVDWDTVALAPPERDLWMLDNGAPATLAAYSHATGRAVDPDAVLLYRLAWVLADVASFVGTLRSEHRADEDTEKAWRAVRSLMRSGPGGGGEWEASYFAPWS